MIAKLENVTLARAGQPLLSDISLRIAAGDRIFLDGENGAGKSSLLQLLALRLHPYNNLGRREYAWDKDVGNFRESRKYSVLIGREEQHRLQRVHGLSTVGDLLLGHADGQDFLYRTVTPRDTNLVEDTIARWQLTPLKQRKLKTLSLGEMRLALIARADMFPRRLYLLDEVFSSLSGTVADRVSLWINRLPAEAAVVVTGHDAHRLSTLTFNRYWRIGGGKVVEDSAAPLLQPVGAAVAEKDSSTDLPPAGAHPLIVCQSADFYHDFVQIFASLAFVLHEGERVLVTGPNGSGKTTLLRIMHGDFYPAWQSGSLGFLHTLAHEQKSVLWKNVQFIAAAHFTYYPARMTVREVLASRISGSIYEYPDTIPIGIEEPLSAFDLHAFFDRPFISLSEGEKTRVLLARAFLLPAPVYLIDEGFIALSGRYFSAATRFLNDLPATCSVVIAANERIGELEAQLDFKLKRWQLDAGRLSTLL